MTCREKFELEHPDQKGIMPANCPSTYGYLDDPYKCYLHNQFRDDILYLSCEDCWNREIPGTEGIHVATLKQEGPEDILKKENNTMEKKTEAQLMEEINANMHNIHELKQELTKLEKYRGYEKSANELHAFYEALVNAGFTEAQAWELFTTAIKLAPLR